MNNTLQLFWSGGLHIAKIFILNKKSAFRQTSSNLLLKRAKSVFFVASSFSLFAPGKFVMLANQ